MKKIFSMLLGILILLNIILPAVVVAREGDCGYEGGISSGESAGKTTYDYQEVCFLSGEPVVFKGRLTIKKSLRGSNITSTYTYTLKNIDRGAAFSRVMTFLTTVSSKENNQKVQETSLSGKYSETIKIGSVTYVLKNYDYTRTNLADEKPAINYYAGNIWGRKTYQISSGTGSSAASGTITVEETGDYYGYDQYWGTAEAQTLKYVISCETKKGTDNDEWGGTADISLSASTTKEIKYIKNKPDTISFAGGYIQTQHNESILEYDCNLPEFDQNGVSTDNMLDKKGSLKLGSFPLQTRLPTISTTKLRGHWAEKEINTMFGLEIFTGKASAFKPDQYIKREEFASVIDKAAKSVPADSLLASKITTVKTNASTQPVVSPFKDVKVTNKYFTSINSVYSRGLMSTTKSKTFSPSGYVTVADALVVFIKVLGLESMAPNPVPVTTFRDNSKIPAPARVAAYIAEEIGLAEADENGNLNPAQKLTKAQVAVMVNKFIDYMRSGIVKDYAERIVNY